jgi:hypothetical protein
MTTVDTRNNTLRDPRGLKLGFDTIRKFERQLPFDNTRIGAFMQFLTEHEE